ncbi:two-component system, NtrC family, C4-dicarboxylate transport sensor histidine kinase DctB [Thalassovita taeanensis]|uniref:C4-dicarboxylate transport sensor protein DctB n=1 Tax=Thalassovita taeanensis TaxID=657014 RepID=A0A1H9KTW2_9RHOB|nr:two-component system, NtrC family, C4-dicarboxylate transport sensor histidine kinase DctB [Thalassovita taeanensis]
MFILFLSAVTVFAGGVWRYGYVQALDQVAQRGEADLTLATDRLTGQLQLYQQLAVLMADHPGLAGLNGAADVARARVLLLEVADKTAALDVLRVDSAGRVLATANGTEPDMVADQPYFQRARQGALGEHHGINAVTGQRAYYFAAPSFDGDGVFSGAVVVVANIGRVEAEWRGARPAVFFTDDDGVVFISNRSELLFWQQRTGGGLRPQTGAMPDFAMRQTGRHEMWLADWSPYVPRRALHLARDLPVIGMRAEALIDVDPARRLAGLQAAVVAAVCLAFGALLFLATERRRTLALANARLETRVAERTGELSAANAALRREVAERSAAEAALKKAQADLVQAGKLSALGQMSAGISHELNQPLMAIQQYAENGALFLDRGKPGGAVQNLERISALAKRMARIIKNLRAFSRQESEPVTRVDLAMVVGSALELSEARLLQEGVALEWHAPPGPVEVMGGEVRLGQVVVNLISNAVDAMAGRTGKRITITLRRAGGQVFLDVADTGPGIREPERIFDPFYSTKEVGASEGMGLGLSISYGLVQSFGGVIRGRNRTGGGAVFTVELTAAAQEAAA